MNTALADLLFWIAIFGGLFVLFRWLQGRKKRDAPPPDE